MPRPKPALADAFSSADAKRSYNRRLFATIADRYDFITRFLSFGRDRHWKKRLIELAGIGPGTRVLDLASGTGDLAWAAAERGGRIVGLDITLRMLVLARGKRDVSRALDAVWIAGDMTALPVRAESFDVVTTGYGLRNVPDLRRAVVEIHRALAPGGLLLSLDFNRPEWAPMRFVYLTYLAGVGSTLGWMLHRDPDTYRYIPASIRRYPGARRVAELLRAEGFEQVQHLPVLGGLMAIHVARKPRVAPRSEDRSEYPGHTT